MENLHGLEVLAEGGRMTSGDTLPAANIKRTYATRVTVVIVTYNSRDTVGDALVPLMKSRDAGAIECIVVDNQSTDRTADFVRAEYPWCTLIESGGNLGFGRAANIGIARSTSPYILLLNPDATLPPEGIERLVAFLDEHPRACAAGPAILSPDGRYQLSGTVLTPKMLLLSALGQPAEVRPIEPGGLPFRANWISGAVVLIRRTMLDQVGVFDPRYFLYFEETDLWVRAQRAGWELWAVGEAVASHVGGASCNPQTCSTYHGCIAEHYFRSRFYYLIRHFGGPTAVATEMLELVFMAVRVAAGIIRGAIPYDLVVRLRAPVLRTPSTRL
jgi:N-acetylglucosaminyl-diphospho-decaprenol L-rhamnosyltransferase